MKLPWTKRAEEAEARAEEAQRAVDDTKYGWLEVLETTGRAHRQHELNHWTETVSIIFSGK